MSEESVPYPRLAIEQQLPRQDIGDSSPATLWLCGATNCITLDGTTDRRLQIPKDEDVIILTKEQTI